MIEPRYQSDRVTLYCADCLDVLPQLEPGSVDAVVTDPPYNLGIDYSAIDDNRADYSDWCMAWFEMLESRVTTIAISCGVANISMWSKAKEPAWVLCWHKSFSVSHGAFGFSNWEPVLVYGKTGKNERASDYFHATFVKEKDAIGHPCPKPIMWAKQIYSIITKKDTTILDPFMGSGTTGVAAMQTGRRFIGIEIDPTYYGIAEKRIRAAEAQLLLGI